MNRQCPLLVPLNLDVWCYAYTCSETCFNSHELTLYYTYSLLTQGYDFDSHDLTLTHSYTPGDCVSSQSAVNYDVFIDFNKISLLHYKSVQFHEFDSCCMICNHNKCELNCFPLNCQFSKCVQNAHYMTKMVVNRLTSRLDAWSKIGTNEMVMKWIKEGVPITFKTPQISFHQKNPKFSIKHCVFIRSELKNLRSKGYIVMTDEKPFVTCPINVVPKKNGKLRLIHNLRKLNENIQLKTFKNEDIRVAIDMVETNDLFTSLDLKDCFYQIPVERKSQRYLGFQFEGKYYYWTVLPFGLNLSPYYCSKVIRPIINFLRYDHNLKIMVYVDDFLCVGTKDVISDCTDTMIHTLEELGWLINHEKSNFIPSMVTDYIGFNINSCGSKNCPEMWVTSARVRKLKHSISRLLGKGSCSARQLARVSGQCISMSLAVKYGKCMLRGVYDLLKSRSDWECLLTLNESAITDLQWWLCEMCSPRKRVLYKKPVEFNLYIDASSTGWGATCNDLHAAGLWNDRLKFQSSNYRELTAILLGLLSFKHLFIGKCIRIYTDNTTARAYLIHQGGPLQQFNAVSKAIWCLISKNEMEIDCFHIAGVQNITADRLSRIVDPFNWTLNRNIFQIIDRELGPHSIDRFASWANHQLPKYNSMFLDPGTSGINALVQQDWGREVNFCAPPFSLINSVLDIAIQQKAKVTLLAPLWKGSPWMVKLKRLCLMDPLVLPHNGNIFQRANTWASTPEPLRNSRWRVGVWSVRGDLA